MQFKYFGNIWSNSVLHGRSQVCNVGICSAICIPMQLQFRIEPAAGNMNRIYDILLLPAIQDIAPVLRYMQRIVTSTHQTINANVILHFTFHSCYNYTRKLMGVQEQLCYDSCNLMDKRIIQSTPVIFSFKSWTTDVVIIVGNVCAPNAGRHSGAPSIGLLIRG
jgi:hypothetical protein